MTADLRFWFDPVCPFAWMTSKWVRTVAAQRSYDVEWRLISLLDCGKGEPGQLMRVSHGCAPARFRDVEVGIA